MPHIIGTGQFTFKLYSQCILKMNLIILFIIIIMMMVGLAIAGYFAYDKYVKKAKQLRDLQLRDLQENS